MTLGHAKGCVKLQNLTAKLASLVGLLQDQVSSQAQGRGACVIEMRLALPVTWASVSKGCVQVTCFRTALLGACAD